MDDLESYYDVLEVSKTATQDEIKKAFHKLASEYHPDKNSGATEKVKRLGEEKFKEVNEAYNVLKDPNKRKQYDAKLREFTEKKQPPKKSPEPTPTPKAEAKKTASPPPPPSSPPPSYRSPYNLTGKQIFWIVVAFFVFIGILTSFGNSTPSTATSTSPSVDYVLSGAGQYQLPNGTFSLYFPNKPTFFTQNQYLLAGKQDYVADNVYKYTDPDLGYSLEGVYIKSAFTDSQATPQENLKNELSYTASNFGNTLITSEPTTYDGFPAIDYTASSSSQYFVGRDVLKGNDLYMVEYFYNSSTGSEDKQLENKFLNSLSFYNASDYSSDSLPTYVDTTTASSTTADTTVSTTPETNDQICKDRNGVYATYNSSDNSCGCADGYTFDKSVNQCVTSLQYCQNSEGVNATYDSTSNSCGCASGYYYGSVSKQCVDLITSRNETCSAQYQNTSFLEYGADGKTNICDCNPGYYWNSDKTACLSQSALNQQCTAAYGDGSYSTTDTTSGKNVCDCSYGYSWNIQRNACVTTSSINQICVTDVGRNSYYQGTVSNGKYDCSTPY